MKASSTDKGHVVVGKDELIHQIAARAGMNLKETSKVINAFTEVVREIFCPLAATTDVILPYYRKNRTGIAGRSGRLHRCRRVV